VIADAHARDAGPSGDNGAGTFMAENERYVHPRTSRREMKVGVAHPASTDLDEGLVVARLGEIDELYLERLPCCVQHRCFSLHDPSRSDLRSAHASTRTL
jgi:hypothetical protein